MTCACAGGRVTVPVVRPAEINLSSYKTLGISGLSGGQAANLVTASLEEELVKAQRFTVVDRSRIDAVMRELQLASTDLADSKNTVKLGALITAGALISGDVQERYVETPHEQRGLSKAGETHYHRWTTADLTLEASLRLTDVSTGALLVAKRVTVSHGSAPNALAQVAKGLFNAVLAQASMEMDSTDPPPDRGRLESEAVKDLVAKFLAAIQPTTELREVQFATDSAVPQLEGGIGWAQHGDWQKAQGVFNLAIQDSERNPKIGAGTLSKVYLDAAIAYEYGGEPDKAQPLLDKAYSLAPGNAQVMREMDSLKRMQAEAKALAEQTAH